MTFKVVGNAVTEFCGWLRLVYSLGVRLRLYEGSMRYE
jgi:hypothetical protein